MASVNKVILIGNTGRDPEIRYLPDGAAVANLSIATSHSWKDKGSGEKKEETEWHKVSAFGRLAEIIGEYVKKGTPVYIEGRLRTRKWKDQEGNDRYTTEIIADQMQMLGKRERSDDGDDQPAASQHSTSSEAREEARPAKQDGGRVADMDDDIPF